MGNPPVRIVPAAQVTASPLPNPVDYITSPYAMGISLEVTDGVAITSPDAPEGARRSLYTTEGLQIGTTEVGPGGGETWHTHLDYYDIVIYVQQGKGEFWWVENGTEYHQEIGTGDLIHIAPGAKNQWLNTGDETLRFIWVGHYHNFAKA